MIKIIVVAIIFAIIVLYLKTINSDLTILALIMSGIILLEMSFDYLQEVFAVFNDLVSLTNLSNEYFKILIKIIGVAYLLEFGISTIEETGLKSLADKLSLAGKIIILFMSMPIIYGVVNVLITLLQ